MVWFSEDVLSTEMIFENYMARLRHIPLEDGDEDLGGSNLVGLGSDNKEEGLSPALQVQNDIAAILQGYFTPDGLVVKSLEFAMQQEHIMDFTRLRALSSLFSMLNQGAR